MGNEIIVLLTPTDPATTCCAHCAEVVPRTLYITNNQGFFPVPAQTLAGQTGQVPWATTYLVSTGGFNGRMSVIITCPNAPGGPWILNYSWTASGNPFPVRAPITYSDDPGCDPDQTFPDPTGAWLNNNNIAAPHPDPGDTVMSA